MADKVKHPVSKDYEKDLNYIKSELGVGISFDIIYVDLRDAGRKMSLFMVDGFVQSETMLFIMKFLARLKPEELDPDPLNKLIKRYIPYVEVSTEDDLDKAVFWVLAGAEVLIVEELDKVIIIDARTYPVRSPQEPDLERVVRGARDGFVETIIFNTALTRRRVRDPSLRMEYMSVGRRSKTDICIAYIEDIANPDIIKRVKASLTKIDTDGLPMGEKTVEEFIAGRHYNPYPTVRYTERPDTAAVHLYEGHILIYVDGSPVVLIAPSTFWNHLQHAEEFRQKPIIGNYMRFVRYISVWMSIFLLPMWYLYATHPELLPMKLDFVTVAKQGQITIFLQLMIIEIGLDILRMATIHTPSSLATALGLVSAVLIGQVAVQVGLFSNEVILYMAVVAVATFATPTYEMSLANRLVRFVFIIGTAIFGLPGYVGVSTLWIIYLVRLKSFHVPYLWPFIPFSFTEIRDVIFRMPLPLKSARPTILFTKDPDK